MATTNSSPLSRRQWLSLTPALASASLATAALVSPARAQEPTSGRAPREGSPGAKVYDVRDFGAIGDGTTLDTAAVQRAIDACHGDRGGIVLVPAGDFLIGTIELKS